MTAGDQPRPRHRGQIVIAEYDPDWPVQFERIKATVADALGELAVAIEHVGSTSVPGLAAKPIIDFDMVVARDSDVEEAIRRLATIGYSHRGDLGIKGREAFDPPPGAYPQHPYLVAAGGRAFLQHITFRDRLRSDEKLRDEYAALKRSLAARHWDDRDGYTEAKSSLIQPVLDAELGVDD